MRTLFDYDFKPKMITKPIRLIELFAGIGSQAKALERMGANFEHYRVCEFDKYAVKSYNAVHGTDFKTSDITKISADDLGIEDTDKYEYIMTYSFPCQDLSNAGKMHGMSKGSGTRSGLLWEVERLLNDCKELPQVLLMENVSQVHGKKNLKDWENWLDTLEQLGYHNYWADLNAKNYSIPQNRNRCFMVSLLGDYTYEFPKGKELKLYLCDMLEDDVDEKYFLSDALIKYNKQDIEFADKQAKIEDSFVYSNYVNQNEKYKSPPLNNVSRAIKSSLADCGVIVKNKGKEVVRTTSIAGTLMARDYKGFGNYEGTGVLVKNATKQGYTEAKVGDSIDLKYSGSKTRRGRVQKDMSHTLTTEGGQAVLVYDEQNKRVKTNGVACTLMCDGSSPNHNPRVIVPKLVGGVGEKKSTNGTQWYQQDRIYDSEGVAMCQPANLPSGSYNYRSDYRIRRLTPLEYWRLMGFDDYDLRKCEMTNEEWKEFVKRYPTALRPGKRNLTYNQKKKAMSDTQLYKQAGNSIVVDVLVAIFKGMIPAHKHRYYKEQRND